MRQNLNEQQNWVVVEIPNLVPHHFKTFNEALNNPIKGHLMTEEYYTTAYKEITAKV
jgi:hypothetical protein